ncbi:uncharacterized protein J4E92_010184 [Alternaria infectoria]|uniref:uncharacterized protein n=1 Tax=Alternaria infectoria TaxID=45303 RepID=UPI00221F48BF|nr:uncharacterized protein J4E92_010184 [Alternaria infectoria]KAI4912139.1 hypothetical protein J4E92_010184 [Alternaria infectoria]
MICELLPYDDQKHARLIDKAWSSVAGTVLWNTFTTNLDEGSTIDALLRSDDILDMIKELDIDGCNYGEEPFPTTTEISSRFVQLLCALPRNSLRAFTTTLDFDERTVGLILKTQSQLSKLSFPSTTLHDKLLTGNLDKLEDLTLLPQEADRHADAKCLAFTPVLRRLAIKPKAQDAHNGRPYSWSMPKLEVLLDLRNIEIHSAFIEEQGDCFGGMTNLSSLQSLLLSNCSDMPRTVQCLADEFLKCDKPALNSVIFRQLNGLEGEKPFNTEIEHFLEAVPTLETLCITTIKAMRPSIGSICRHGESLRYLHIDHFPNLYEYRGLYTGNVERYTPQELERLVASCPRIEALSLNLVDWDLGDYTAYDTFNVHDTGRGLQEDVKVSDLLLPLTQLRNLRNLRITYPLFQAQNEEQEETYDYIIHRHQLRYQQVANVIMEFFADHESPIELLAFGPGYWPEDTYSSAGWMDMNGHSFPDFSYRRGIVTVAMRGGKQVSRAVAVPMLEQGQHEAMLFWK